MTEESILRARQNCCRLCLAPDSECISIFNSYAADKEPLATKIQSCVNIKVSPIDRLSLRICHACISYLNSWQSFKNRCVASQNKQRSWLDISKKIEKKQIGSTNPLTAGPVGGIGGLGGSGGGGGGGGSHEEGADEHENSPLATSILEGISSLKKRRSLTVYPIPVHIKDEPMDEEEYDPKHDESDIDPTLFLERTEEEGSDNLSQKEQHLASLGLKQATVTAVLPLNYLSCDPDRRGIQNLAEDVSSVSSENSDNDFELPDDDEIEPEDCHILESDNEEEMEESNKIFMGKDKLTKWYRKPTINANPQPVSHFPGPQNEAINAKTSLECFSLYLNDEIMEIIIESTNLNIQKNRDKFSISQVTFPTDKNEMKSFIGLLLILSTHGFSTLKLEDLWRSNGLGVNIFHKTMVLNRFRYLLRSLRFDDYQKLDFTGGNDKFVRIRNVFEKFVVNCERYFNLGEYVTVKEEFLHLERNSVKKRIKVFSLCDAATWYTSKLSLYTGNEKHVNVSNSSADVMVRMVSNIEGTSRNITLDSGLTSAPLAKYLLTKQLTIVGAVAKNKPELPNSFIRINDRHIGSSIFAFQDHMTIVSHIPKKNDLVLLMSTMPFYNEEEIINFYNLTKGKSANTNTSSRNCNRWSLRIFYHMLDIAIQNAYVIYSYINKEDFTSIRQFMEDIGLKLIQQQSDSVLLNVTERVPINIAEILKDKPTVSGKLKKSRCTVCPRSFDLKTTSTCNVCQMFLCKKHLILICPRCFESRLN